MRVRYASSHPTASCRAVSSSLEREGTLAVTMVDVASSAAASPSASSARPSGSPATGGLVDRAEIGAPPSPQPRSGASEGTSHPRGSRSTSSATAHSHPRSAHHPRPPTATTPNNGRTAPIGAGRLQQRSPAARRCARATEPLPGVAHAPDSSARSRTTSRSSAHSSSPAPSCTSASACDGRAAGSTRGSPYCERSSPSSGWEPSRGPNTRAGSSAPRASVPAAGSRRPRTVSRHRRFK